MPFLGHGLVCGGMVSFVIDVSLWVLKWLCSEIL